MVSCPIIRKKVCGEKHPIKVDKHRNSIPCINHFIPKYIDKSGTGQPVPGRAGHHRPSLAPSADIYIQGTVHNINLICMYLCDDIKSC